MFVFELTSYSLLQDLHFVNDIRCYKLYVNLLVRIKLTACEYINRCKLCKCWLLHYLQWGHFEYI